jgi:hypothetical protein
MTTNNILGKQKKRKIRAVSNQSKKNDVKTRAKVKRNGESEEKWRTQEKKESRDRGLVVVVVGC